MKTKVIDLPSGGQATIKAPGVLTNMRLMHKHPDYERLGTLAKLRPSQQLNIVVDYVEACCLEPRLSGDLEPPDGVTSIEDIDSGDLFFMFQEINALLGEQQQQAEDKLAPLSETEGSSSNSGFVATASDAVPVSSSAKN